jgi:hypothetical protein
MILRKRDVLLIVSMLVLAVTALAADPPAATPVPMTVKGKVYDVWVSQSFAPPPREPFHDCARFTETQMCLDQCGDCGVLQEYPVFGTPQFTFWIGRVPCGDLNLVFVGTSHDGLPGPGGMPVPVMGASAVGTTQGSSFGVEGTANMSCAVNPTSRTSKPYSRSK